MSRSLPIRDAGDLLQFPVRFRNLAGESLVPTRIRYKFVDVTKNLTVLDWVDHVDLSADTVIEVGRPYTHMQNSSLKLEQKRFTIYADFGTAAKPEVTSFDLIIRNSGSLPAYV